MKTQLGPLLALLTLILGVMGLMYSEQASLITRFVSDEHTLLTVYETDVL